jgi:uncharacterized membrane protein YozB (DUF420 family)
MAINPVALPRDVSSPFATVNQDTERWFYAAMALWFVAIALGGFIPSSIEKINAVQAAQRPPFPWFMHAHAVVMGAWLSLLLAQSLLVARGRVAVHRRLGVASFVLVPLIVVLMFVMMIGGLIGVSAIPPGAMPPEVLATTKYFVTNLTLAQVQAIVLFPLFIGWALAVRKTDSAMHKRLMFFGTAIPLLAGIDRITGKYGWTTVPESGDSMYLNLLVIMMPALIFDLARTRRLHRAYVYGLASAVACFLMTHFLWGTPAWHGVVTRMLGAFGVAEW